MIGEQTMPQRLLKPFWALFSWNDPTASLWLLLVSTVGAVSQWASDLPAVTRILGLLMVCDWMAGYRRAKMTKTWNKKKGWDGLQNKLVVFSIVVIFFHIVRIAGVELWIYSALVSAICWNEGKSIRVNLERAKIDLGPEFDAVLSRIGKLPESRMGTETQNPEQKKGNGHG
jgi:phage-related holin